MHTFGERYVVCSQALGHSRNTGTREHGVLVSYLHEFYIMDVILNRRSPSPGDPLDPEVVRPFLSYKPGDDDREKDYLFRAAILFLPQCGVFCCHRDRQRGHVGVANTFIAHDIATFK